MQISFHSLSKQVIKIILAILLVSMTTCTFLKDKSPLKIVFNSKAYISLVINNVQKPFNFQMKYLPNLSVNDIYTPKYTIHADTTFILELTAHMPQDFEFTLNQTNIPFFTALEDTIHIIYNDSSHQVTYTGINKNINEYLLIKHEIQQNIDLKMRSLYHQHKLPYQDQHRQFDSLASIQHAILETSQVSIPHWYKSLESQHIIFKTAHAKLSLASYRNFLEHNQENTPSDLDLAFLKKLNLSSPYNQYLSEFYSFMNFYSFYLIYGNGYVNSDSVSLLFQADSLSTKMFESFESIEIPSNNFQAFCVDQTIKDIARERNRRNGRIDYLTSKYGQKSSFVTYLIEENNKLESYSLKEGDQAPNFYLEDLAGASHNLSTYRGKVVLLNFYTKGCLPCIKEVPYEKKLQAEYNQQLQIINICHTNSKDHFQKAVDKFQMEDVNVYTQGNWKDIVEKKYRLVGYPHYTLIDKKGRVIKNNTFKPSSGKLQDLINSAL